MPILHDKIRIMFQYPPAEHTIKTVKRITILENDKITIEYSRKTYEYAIRIKLPNKIVLVATGNNHGEDILIYAKWQDHIDELYNSSLSIKETMEAVAAVSMSASVSVREASLTATKTEIDNLFK